MAVTKIIILVFIFLVTPTAPRLRGHSSIKQHGSSSTKDFSSTTRYFTLTHASMTHYPSTRSTIPLNDTSWIMPTPPVLQYDHLIRNSIKGDTADLSTSASTFVNPPTPTITDDGLFTNERFTTPPAPVIQNGGLHSATRLSPPTSSYPSSTTKGMSSASVVEPVSRSAPRFTSLRHTTPAAR